jgi:hypothetical protein
MLDENCHTRRKKNEKGQQKSSDKNEPPPSARHQFFIKSARSSTEDQALRVPNVGGIEKPT